MTMKKRNLKQKKCRLKCKIRHVNCHIIALGIQYTCSDIILNQLCKLEIGLCQSIIHTDTIYNIVMSLYY